MTSIAVHMRITGLQVSNEDVNSRKAAVAELEASWRQLRQVPAIVAKAAAIAAALGGDGIPSETLGAEVEQTVQKQASAFLYSERPLDVGIIAGITALELLSVPSDHSGWTITDIWAAALWLTLGYQPPLPDPKREALRAEVFKAARSRSVSSAEQARGRNVVPEFGEFVIHNEEEGATAGAASFKEATSGTIEALRRNAALDREELDFLWWALLGRSRLLAKSLGGINEPTRIVAAGIEGAGLLRRFPCEVHRDVVLRTLDTNPELDLAELLAAIGDDRAKLGGRFQHGLVAGSPSAFPLLHALASGSVAGSGAEVKRTTEEWGTRALLEAALATLKTESDAL